MAVKPIPDGYHSLTPYLIVDNGAAAIEFYKQVFGATELFRMANPDTGKVGHAEVRIGDSVVMLADQEPEMGAKSPAQYGGTPVGLMLYVEDCDATFAAAVKAGARVDRPLADQFYGDRNGTIIDPFGHKWTIGTHKEDLTPEEMDKRLEAMKK